MGSRGTSTIASPGFHIGEEDTLTAQLATLGYSPKDVDTAILSHLHEDH